MQRDVFHPYLAFGSVLRRSLCHGASSIKAGELRESFGRIESRMRPSLTLQFFECDNTPLPTNAAFPIRPLDVPGPDFTREFWGGSLFSYCAAAVNGNNPSSNYGPQCSCVQSTRQVLLAHYGFRPGDVVCRGTQSNGIFLSPQFGVLLGLCHAHCYCSQIVPAYGSMSPGERRPNSSPPRLPASQSVPSDSRSKVR